MSILQYDKMTYFYFGTRFEDILIKKNKNYE